MSARLTIASTASVTSGMRRQTLLPGSDRTRELSPRPPITKPPRAGARQQTDRDLGGEVLGPSLPQDDHSRPGASTVTVLLRRPLGPGPRRPPASASHRAPPAGAAAGSASPGYRARPACSRAWSASPLRDGVLDLVHDALAVVGDDAGRLVREPGGGAQLAGDLGDLLGRVVGREHALLGREVERREALGRVVDDHELVARLGVRAVP